MSDDTRIPSDAESQVPIVIHPPVHGVDPDAAVAVTDATVTSPDSAPRALPPQRPMGADRSDEPLVATSTGPVAAPPELALPEPRRAYSLDALRGIFLVSMTLGFTIVGDFFPGWMYHRQFPPPYKLVEVAGLTWRDLAFAAFIFSMAAALPISLSRMIAKGTTEFGILFAAIRRFALLMVFALLIGHANTYFTGYTQEARALALAGFIIMFAIFVRRRRDWSQGTFRTINTLGWIAAIAFLALSPLVYGESFKPSRIDDIISGLAFAALAGSVIWYFTRENLVARLAILAVVVALYLSSRQTGWVQSWWWSSAVPWLGGPNRLTLLTVVIPGTIAGDLLNRWMQSGDDAVTGWGAGRYIMLALVGAAFTPLIVLGLDNRFVSQTIQVALALVALGTVITWSPKSAGEKMLRSMFCWGAMWLMLGLLLDPAEGGIHKVPESLSYFFTVTGASILLLVALAALMDVRRGGRWLSPFVDVGQNPMLCYVLYSVFINSLLEMIVPMRSVLRSSAGESLLRSIISTIVVILIVRFFTRRRIFWRT